MDTDTPPPGGFLPTSPQPTGRVLVIYSNGDRREWIINSRRETDDLTIYTVTPRKDSTP